MMQLLQMDKVTRMKHNQCSKKNLKKKPLRILPKPPETISEKSKELFEKIITKIPLGKTFSFAQLEKMLYSGDTVPPEDVFDFHLSELISNNLIGATDELNARKNQKYFSFTFLCEYDHTDEDLLQLNRNFISPECNCGESNKLNKHKTKKRKRRNTKHQLINLMKEFLTMPSIYRQRKY
ncbi:hypothetical protein M153_1370006936 [Pseudoloma neurophilia]|uniref:Uncharacterized protein n=1 Tax=Pseudoloma neurophilia TaxID=146866 RepID=A0A0R0LZT0_9MICR|nr:hypothetical protein M153_1370006936 [Pseudoloma neurophilia]